VLPDLPLWVWGTSVYALAGAYTSRLYVRKVGSDPALKRDYDAIFGPVEDLMWLVPPALHDGLTPQRAMRWMFAASVAVWWPVVAMSVMFKQFRNSGNGS